jgi:protoheme IX farnesyltransferase
MKATVQPLPQVAPAEKSWVGVFADLFKARLTLLVLMTTFVGFHAGSAGPLNVLLLAHTILGTALLAGAAAALNELIEREPDSRMRRTRDRPLPSGRMQPQTVLGIGILSAGLGLAQLAFRVNLVTAGLGAASLLLYLFVYTPLKRVTWWNTAIGAIPGGLPPLIGWAAARGELSAGGLVLFAILALWQFPHFMAIAWIYREEYARAGFRMLPVIDFEGRRTGRLAATCAVALLPVSLCPFLLKLTGPLYLAGALACGFAFLACAIDFRRRLTIAAARRLFFASILYLPTLFGVLVLDKLRG